MTKKLREEILKRAMAVTSEQLVEPVSRATVTEIGRTLLRMNTTRKQRRALKRFASLIEGL